MALPGAHKSGDSVADRSFPRSREVSSGCAWDITPMALPGAHESGNNFADHSLQGNARSRLGVRGTPLRWLPQEPTKVATTSQIAAPSGNREVSLMITVPLSES